MAHIAQIQLPPCRIVEGSASRSTSLGMNGRKLDQPQFYIGLAMPKSDPRVGEVWQAYMSTALQYFASNNYIIESIRAGIRPNGFAFKWVDGDDPKRRDREGNAGHWILKVKSIYAFKVVDQNNQPIDPAVLKTGFYADALLGLDGNKQFNDKAGLFVNPIFIRWLFPGYGKEIISGPDANKVMGAAPTSPPPGAQQAPGGYGGPAGGYPGPAGNHQPAGGIQGNVPGMAPGAYPAPSAGPSNVGYQATSPAAHAPQSAPGGWQEPAVNPQQTTHYPAATGMATGPSNGPNGGNVSGPATYAAPAAPHSHPQQPAGGPAVPAGATQHGAPSMHPGQASPTAYPSSAPVHGFSHGNPNG
jgi:hypothetical protein